MTTYAYSVTQGDDSRWNVVNRSTRTIIKGSFKTQKEADNAAIERAKWQASQGNTVTVYTEDTEGNERLVNKYYPTDDDSE